MARTAHHRRSRSLDTYGWSPGSPWSSVVLHDRRYSVRDVTEATQKSRRPTPSTIRRTVDVYSLPRYRQDRSVALAAATEERRARQRLRARVGLLLRLVNSPADALVHDAADAVDVPPARHRRSALWLA